MIQARTKSVDDTRALAAELAPLARPGDLILLEGGLGAGKTAFVQGFVIGGATGVVRATASFARGIQTGLIRSYALLLVLGLGGLGLYFLLVSS